MRAKKTIQLLLTCVIVVTMMSCGAFKQCDDIGNDFYNCLKHREFEKALEFLDEEALNATPRDIWLNGLTEKDRALGPLLSVQRQDFESYTVDNVTRLAIKYKTQYSSGKMYERLEFIERNDDFKITFYKYNEDSTLVE